MSIYLRWGGAILLMLGALFVSREYEKYLRRRVAEYRGLVSLINHAEDRIKKSLAHGSGLWRDFSDGAMERCGILDLLRSGEGLYSAFSACSDRLALSREAKARIAEELSTLGRGYMNDELERLSAVGSRLTAECEFEEADADKNIKVSRALLLGGALSAVILVI